MRTIMAGAGGAGHPRRLRRYRARRRAVTGVPVGHNRARDLAVAIDKAANAVLILTADATTHRATIIKRDWSRVQSAVRAAGCS